MLIATIIGTPAFLAWQIASTVCGMTWSSAATTSTTMSVTCAPRARMAVKASWPGVSRKVIWLAVRQRDVVRADVLRDAAGFAGDHVRLADVVEQRRLAVVDVTHDGDDGRTRTGALLGASTTSSASTASAAYSSSLTAWKPNSEAISSIWSKSRRWFTVTIRPSSLKANWTIWVAGIFMISASSRHGDELVDADPGLLALALLGRARRPSGPR